MRMLRWMCRLTEDKTRNERMRGSVKELTLIKKIAEKRLKWYGHVKRREEGHMLIIMVDAPVPGKRRRGRQIFTTCQKYTKTYVVSLSDHVSFSFRMHQSLNRTASCHDN